MILKIFIFLVKYGFAFDEFNALPNCKVGQDELKEMLDNMLHKKWF